MIYSFEPIADDSCRVLILGTMPGAQSLKKQEYYGNRNNAFWRIMFTIFNEELTEDYNEKKAFLLRQHIALWDVLKACDREGSGDAEIENPVPNDFAGFLKKYPGIRCIYFNGGNAEKFFKQYVAKNIPLTGITLHRLPSTSPAYVITFDKKLSQWAAIREQACNTL